MKVKDLIKELEKFEQDDFVYVWSRCECGRFDFEISMVRDKMDRYGTKILLSGDEHELEK